VKLIHGKEWGKNPLAFYKQLIQELMQSFPSPLNTWIQTGDVQKVVQLVGSFHDTATAVRFLLLWARLLDARIQCDSFAPGLAILPRAREVNDAMSEKAWELVGKPRKVLELRRPNPILGVPVDSFFHLFEDASLEQVLTDGILLSDVLSSSMQLIPTNFIRTGHFHLSLVIRAVVLQLSVLNQLYKVKQRDLILEMLNHVQTLMNFLRLLLTMTYALKSHQQPPWTGLLNEKVNHFDGLNMEWNMKFYASTVADVT
jgi:hypothetical protein